MLSKLRTDIREKLKNIKYLLVDGEMFRDNASQNEPGQSTSEDLGRLTKKLDDLGVGIIIFSGENCDFTEQNTGAEFYRCNAATLADHINGNGKQISFGDCILVAYSETDKELMRISAFSFAPSSASLDVKMLSSYASHEDGIDALSELSELIASAKTYPHGFGK